MVPFMFEHLRAAGIDLDVELGRGAHSVVYRARFQGLPCAVKLPLADTQAPRWVYREAVSIARVKHANLPAVLDVGEINGLPYLVMELVEGETLAGQLARGRLDENEVIGLVRQLASALAAIHDAGLVH